MYVIQEYNLWNFLISVYIIGGIIILINIICLISIIKSISIKVQKLHVELLFSIGFSLYQSVSLSIFYGIYLKLDENNQSYPYICGLFLYLYTVSNNLANINISTTSIIVVVAIFSPFNYKKNYRKRNIIKYYIMNIIIQHLIFIYGFFNTINKSECIFKHAYSIKLANMILFNILPIVITSICIFLLLIYKKVIKSEKHGFNEKQMAYFNSMIVINIMIAVTFVIIYSPNLVYRVFSATANIEIISNDRDVYIMILRFLKILLSLIIPVAIFIRMPNLFKINVSRSMLTLKHSKVNETSNI